MVPNDGNATDGAFGEIQAEGEGTSSGGTGTETILSDMRTILNQLEERDRCAPCNRARSGLVDMMQGVGQDLYTYFQSQKEPRYIDLVIRYQKVALKETPQDDPRLAGLLSELAVSYHARYMLLNRFKDVEKAIEYQSRAVSLMPKDHPSLASQLNNLGNSYHTRFEYLGKLEDIDRAIECQSRAISSTPEGHTKMASQLNNLSVSYKSRFEHFGKREDIDKAIHFNSQAISLMPEKDMNILKCLINLGNSHRSRFERFGELEDIDTSVEYHSSAVSLAPEDHPLMSVGLSHLGISHRIRFGRLGRIEDIDEAIRCQSKAVSLTPMNSKQLNLAMGLTNLGVSHQCRFEQLGRLEDIDKAIEYHSRAVSIVPKGHPMMSGWLNNLGSSYQSRFGRLGKQEDIDKAIECHSEAVSLAPEKHPRIVGCLNNLGISYHRRFDSLGKLQDLDKAIEYQSRAVLLTPQDHTNMSGRLNNLGISYQSRFKRLGRMEDLDKAIDYKSRALALMPEGHIDISWRLNNLGISYQTRFKQLGKPEDIDTTIEYQAKAILLMPEGHANMSFWLYNLGDSYKSKHQRLASPGALTHAIECFRQSALSNEGEPQQRFEAALQWVELTPLQSSSEALLAFQTAIDLIPRVVWMGETITQRYDDVREIGSLAIRAAAMAISAGEYDRALEWLEQGRSVVWNQALQLRTPFDQLSSVNPELAEMLRNVATELNNAASQSKGQINQFEADVSPEQAAQRHRRLAEKYDELIEKIRSIEGFEGFLRPKMAPELLRAAQAGPVIIINVHTSRCDALVLHPGESHVQCIPLPNLTHSGVVEARENLDKSLQLHDLRERHAGFRRPDRATLRVKLNTDPFEEVLGTLWSAIAAPVLRSLGYLKQPPTNDMPHVTWCTTGPLSFLPLHASGHYHTEPVKVSDFVISSYTPTVSALLATTTLPPTNHSRILAVGQEATSGHARLPGTKSELALIQKYAQPPHHYEQIINHNATKSSVLAGMQTSDWVHLACHASQDIHDPTESGFMLQDGTLSISTIMQKSLGNKGLAFLSACQTATGDSDRPDESVHLASSMLLAGYASVIGTMWSVRDQDAPVVAGRVYSQILSGGMDCRGTAKALHIATKELREQVGEKEFGRWVPYIHIGI